MAIPPEGPVHAVEVNVAVGETLPDSLLDEKTWTEGCGIVAECVTATYTLPVVSTANPNGDSLATLVRVCEGATLPVAPGANSNTLDGPKELGRKLPTKRSPPGSTERQVKAPRPVSAPEISLVGVALPLAVGENTEMVAESADRSYVEV
jgi:hypothetical protein